MRTLRTNICVMPEWRRPNTQSSAFSRISSLVSIFLFFASLFELHRWADPTTDYTVRQQPVCCYYKSHFDWSHGSSNGERIMLCFRHNSESIVILLCNKSNLQRVGPPTSYSAELLIAPNDACAVYAMAIDKTVEFGLCIEWGYRFSGKTLTQIITILLLV